MSEEFVTYKDFGEFQKNIGSLTAEVGSLKTAIKEQHDSMIPFIRGVNADMEKLNTRVTKVEKKYDKYYFKFVGAITVIVFVATMFAEEIKNWFLK